MPSPERAFTLFQLHTRTLTAAEPGGRGRGREGGGDAEAGIDWGCGTCTPVPTSHCPAGWLCLGRAPKPLLCPQPLSLSVPLVQLPIICPRFQAQRPHALRVRQLWFSRCCSAGRGRWVRGAPLTHRGPRAGRSSSCSAGCWGRRRGSRGSGSRRPGCSASLRTWLQGGQRVT